MELKEYVKTPQMIAKDIRAMVASGEVDPMAVKVMFDVFKRAVEDDYIQDAIMDEARKHGEEFEYMGSRYKILSNTRYVYKHDPEWQRIDGMRKAREEMMKMACKHEVADPNTGELVPAAEVKHGKDYLRRV